MIFRIISVSHRITDRTMKARDKNDSVLRRNPEDDSISDSYCLHRALICKLLWNFSSIFSNLLAGSNNKFWAELENLAREITFYRFNNLWVFSNINEFGIPPEGPDVDHNNTHLLCVDNFVLFRIDFELLTQSFVDWPVISLFPTVQTFYAVNFCLPRTITLATLFTRLFSPSLLPVDLIGFSVQMSFR